MALSHLFENLLQWLAHVAPRSLLSLSTSLSGTLWISHTGTSMAFKGLDKPSTMILHARLAW
jgi:hypothetical protein